MQSTPARAGTSQCRWTDSMACRTLWAAKRRLCEVAIASLCRWPLGSCCRAVDRAADLACKAHTAQLHDQVTPAT